MIFPFKEKGFPRKSLCFCVVVLPLCLLKYIHSYIEFFPTYGTTSKIAKMFQDEVKHIYIYIYIYLEFKLSIVGTRFSTTQG